MNESCHSSPLLEERFRAVMLGLAVGDTLGMPVEGWKKEQIQKYVGRITHPIDPLLLYDQKGDLITADEFGQLKYFTKDFQRGQYTDDTILSKALAESLAAERSFNLTDIAEKQVEEYRKRLLPDGSVFGGFGRTTTEAFKLLLAGVSPLESGVIGGPGNAPAMKMAPLSLYATAYGERNAYHDGLQQAELISRMTHLDPRSVASGVTQFHAVYVLLQNVSRDEFVDSCTEICLKHEKPVDNKYALWKRGSLSDRLRWIHEHRDVKPSEAHAVLGSTSNVFSSYPFALFMFQRHWDDPIEGLIETVNGGGDCDTTGSIYGALTGAKNGIIFPREWLDVLDRKEELEKIGSALFSLSF